MAQDVIKLQDMYHLNGLQTKSQMDGSEKDERYKRMFIPGNGEDGEENIGEHSTTVMLLAVAELEVNANFGEL